MIKSIIRPPVQILDAACWIEEADIDDIFFSFQAIRIENLNWPSGYELYHLNVQFVLFTEGRGKSILSIDLCLQ